MSKGFESSPSGVSNFQLELAKARYAKRDQTERLLESKKFKMDSVADKKKKFVETTAQIPTRVVRINVDGLAATKDAVITGLVSELLNVKTYADLVTTTRSVHYKLKHLGCFSAVDVFLDTCKDDDSNDNGDLEITFTVQECGNWFKTLFFQAEDNEVHMAFETGVPNLRGKGERLEALISQGTQGTRIQSLSFVSPMRNFIGAGDPKVSTLSAYIMKTGQQFSSLSLDGSSLSLGVEAIFTPKSWIRQSVRWQIDWRQLIAKTSTSFYARDMCGHSLKSAVLHRLSIDTRDDVFLPTSGVTIDASQELAGLGGDVCFLKNVLEGSIHQKLTRSLSLSISGAAGLLKPVNCGKRRLNHSFSLSAFDTFSLGNQLCMRGFMPCGLVSSDNPVGGRAFWRLSTQTYFLLPYLRGKTWMTDNIRGHLFAEAASIGNPGSRRLMKSLREPWVTDYRSTVGLGLVFRLGSFARAELNYCWPFLTGHNDRAASGLHFGLGVNFS